MSSNIAFKKIQLQKVLNLSCPLKKKKDDFHNIAIYFIYLYLLSTYYIPDMPLITKYIAATYQTKIPASESTERWDDTLTACVK